LRRPAVTCATCFSAGPRISSRSTRTTCWCRATIRVFTIVRKSGSSSTSRSRFCARAGDREGAAAVVGADRADDRDAVNELSQIARHIGRAARIKGLAGHLDHRHGRLGRDAADLAPDEFVEHQVAGYGDALTGGPGEDFPQTFELH
jgi:hypothetical protein